MELVNRLPIPAFAFRQYDRNGNYDCVVAARGTFLHVQDDVLRLSPDQEDFQWEDAYAGDPHQSLLLRQTDLTPEKPGTDVTFLGDAHAPGSRPLKSWLCSIRIGALSKTLRVHGPRMWKPVTRDRWGGFSSKEPKRVLEDWQLTDADVTDRVALGWHNAFGGRIPGSENAEAGTPADVERFNPLGCGIVNLGMQADVGPQLAPCITGANEMTLDWRDRIAPQGFGPIPPWWRQRQQYTGSYDDAWLEKRHPLLPEDFDPRFWQCADPDLIALPWLQGDESYELEHLHREFPQARGRLPGVTLGVHCLREDRDEWHMLNLDGVHFDWREDDRVLITWRARFPLQEAGETTLTLSRVVFHDEADDPPAGTRREAAE